MEESYGLQDYSDGSATFSVDPVCGSNVDESCAAANTIYAGQVYYFCSNQCQLNFEEEPPVYLGLPH